MEKLEKTKKKHDHLLTKLLKFGIFAICMLAPFISVLSKAMYVTFNKNAKESYSGETQQNETFENISFDQMNIGNEYYTFTSQPTWIDTSATTMIINVSNVKNYGPMSYVSGINFTIDEVDKITIWTPSNASSYILSFELHKTGEQQYYYISSLQAYNFSFVYEGGSGLNDTAKTLFSQFLYEKQYIDKQYMDNVFYYAIDQLENENIFNWSKNTGIYTAIETMTNGLGINNVVAMLLAYWSLLTCVYVVFDIIIELFIRLTHMINAD